MHSWRSLATLTLLCVTNAFAQSTPDKPATPATIQVTSRIVYVDVVVRDTYGRIVRGLAEKDFHVLEDGKPQQIDFFRDHTHDPMPTPAGTTNKDGSLSFSNVEPAANTPILSTLFCSISLTQLPPIRFTRASR